ncbi:hypothetical protein NPIL_156361 [Nephila pilipes]|uniref:Uncharacterized protein n=1 Tax=Nephila pilipes TaxID=299642 RepID=A0A8X6PT07_NEPPI|nr:hypothetical protein NPIL_156361 [Nephila pilipes]
MNHILLNVAFLCRKFTSFNITLSNLLELPKKEKKRRPSCLIYCDVLSSKNSTLSISRYLVYRTPFANLSPTLFRKTVGGKLETISPEEL